MKLKKRLPESRSQKKERLAADRDRRAMERVQALDRREAWLAQHDRSKVLFHEWHNAVVRRLDSDAAYERFEATHRRYWDLFRHVGLPSTELSLTLQRHHDGKPLDPEPLVDELEHQTHFSPLVAHLTKQLARENALSPEQRLRVQAVIVRRAAFDGWHRHIRYLARLARAVSSPELSCQLQALPKTPQIAHVLEHLEQEAHMATRTFLPAPETECHVGQSHHAPA